MTTHRMIRTSKILSRASTVVAALALFGCELHMNATNPHGHEDPTVVPDSDAGTPTTAAKEFQSAETCVQCHATHYKEWQGSVMHYAAASPVFNAFELTVQKLSEGFVAANGEAPNFCIGCHSPTGVYNNELPDFVSADSATTALSNLSPVSRQGVTCDVCHTVTGPDLDKSPLGDGIANLALKYAPTNTKVGPFSGAVDNPNHASTNSEYLQTSEFCGSCHDVRIPMPDQITGEPFQRVENLFTEWKNGPYNSTDNPYGKVVSCQDCHMSLFPMKDPGTYPEMIVGVAPNAEPRKHALHAFTAVSKPFIDDPQFPRVDTDETDVFGFPLGQEQRRAQMLRAACTLTLDTTPSRISADDSIIPVEVVVTNVGAGHRVPAGFSEERQVWIELVVRDDRGIIYESGYLRDKAHPETGEMEPDGLLDDEDLEHEHYEVDLETLDTHHSDGPDANQRPEVNLGIMNFQNQFIRINEDGTHEPVLNPLLANTIKNDNSLDMLKPKTVKYDIPMPDRAIEGDIKVTARLRYRAFPPEFLRLLALREPQLVNEEIVDRNTIVDMVESETTISVR